ncbi:MAG: TIGR03089 family protein [Mycobacteriaceae bacterium]|nr:TIGR03089 family protein [Mycobacteriaceae bacterium]
MANLAAAVLDPLLRTDPAGPRITYYDDATGERIELSTATLANWAAKTGNLLRDELAAGPGSRVAVLLPAHWQTSAVLLGIWWIGAEVVLGGGGDVAMCTRERLLEAGADEVVALSLDPFGAPLADLPVGATDYATSVRVHGDQIIAEARPGPALDGRSVDDVLSAALESAGVQGITGDDRVMSTAVWDSDDALVNNMLAVLAVGASLVQVANPDPKAMERRTVAEKVTRVLG